MWEVMQAARYWTALIVLATVPPAILFWYLIHPLTRFWRRLGTVATYLVVGSLCLGAAALILVFRQPLMENRLPFRWELAAAGLLLYGLAVVVEIQCRRHLKLRTLVGVPQLRGERGRLLTQGIYARTRNPRYLGVILGVGGWALILNYPALYLVGLLSLPALYWLIRLEELELEERFGEEYRSYKRRVPRLIPRLRIKPDRDR